MASTQAKAYRRATALESLNRTVRRFSKLYDIEVPDVTAPNLRDPEMGRIQLIEGMDTMLKDILKKADPTAEAEAEVAERDAQAEAEAEQAKADAQAAKEQAREERKLFGGRPDLTTETDERVAEVSEAIEAGEPVPAATPPPSPADEVTTTTEEGNEVATPGKSTTTTGGRKPGNTGAGKKLSK